MTEPAPSRVQLLRLESPDIVQVELYSHGPQWQRRLRFAMGQPARLVGHGQAFCSVELAEILTRLFLDSGLQCRIADRSGPQPVFYRSQDPRPHRDERSEPREA